MSENKRTSTMTCAVARDLMPLYVENLTEEETTALLREHISQCPACAQNLGAQQTRIEIGKKDEKQDDGGVQFLRKARRKRIVLILLAVVLAYVLLTAGYNFLFNWRGSSAQDVTMIGRYQLADGRIVLAWTVKGVYPGTDNGWNNRAYKYIDYEYTSGQEANPYSFRKDLGTIGTSNWNRWFTEPDERGEVFYYLFDPEETYAAAKENAIGWNPYNAGQLRGNALSLEDIYVNNYCIWQRGDETRAVGPEEEAALLAAVEKARWEEPEPRAVDEAQENELLVQLVRKVDQE